MPEPGNWIYFYQTLITGAAAVIAAVISIIFLWQQIQEAKKQFEAELAESKQRFLEELNESKRQFNEQIAEGRRQVEDQRMRTLRAVRAGLPNSLAEITHYATSCCRELFRALEQHRENGRREVSLALPPFPYGAFDALRPVIEAATESDAKVLANFVSLGQIQRSRLESLANRVGPNPTDANWVIGEEDFIGRVRDSLGLYAFADCVYGYARGRSDSIDDICSAEEASSKLQLNMGINDPEVYRGVMRPWPPGI